MLRRRKSACAHILNIGGDCLMHSRCDCAIATIVLIVPLGNAGEVIDYKHLTVCCRARTNADRCSFDVSRNTLSKLLRYEL